MTVEQAVQEFTALQKKLCALSHASGLLYYDGVTTAPRDTAANRSETLGVLSELQYEASAGERTGELLAFLEEHRQELSPVAARACQWMLRDLRKLRKIPVDEYVAFGKLTSDASDVWHRAKEADDWPLFQPYMEKIVETLRRFAGYYDPAKAPYDVWLDEYERGLTREKCDAFFAALRSRLVPLVREIGARPPVSAAPFAGPAPAAAQAKLANWVMGRMGIDRNHCGLGETEHPFTINFTRYDVRITTHYQPDDFTSSLFSVIHESGHALYELHIGEELAYTVLGNGVSMGIHESQSRFYENLLGRSREFCAFLFPQLRELFPERTAGATADDYWRYVNRVQPSLIRTEADEATYCLHIMVRYTLEKALLDGSLAVRDLPGEWNRLYREYLGVEVPSNRAGVLQDSHWSGGSLGYFPSYALGSAYGAQLLARMGETVNVPAAMEKGDFAPVNRWLEENIWRYGCLYEPGELLEKALGAPFDPKYYTDYLEQKYGALYGL